MKNDVSIFDLVKKLPINSEDTLFVSSDLFKLAVACRRQKIKFSADMLLDALLATIPNGTLVIPAYTDQLKSGDRFDILHSKPNTGALSEATFKRSEFIRTYDPFHSFLVAGKHQENFVQLHNQSTFGSDSGFALLHKLNAKAIFIDVSLQDSFTFVHYCEEKQKVKYRTLKAHQMHYVSDTGEESIITHQFFTRKKGYINNLHSLEKHLTINNILESHLLLNSTVKIANYNDLFEFISEDIALNKARNVHKFSFYEYFRCTAKQILSRK